MCPTLIAMSMVNASRRWENVIIMGEGRPPLCQAIYLRREHQPLPTIRGHDERVTLPSAPQRIASTFRDLEYAAHSGW